MFEMQNESEKSNSNFPNKNKAQAIRCKSVNNRLSGSFCSDLGLYLQFLNLMQNEKIKKEQHLNDLFSQIEPQQAQETFQTIFLGYITTDDYCSLNQVERHNLVYVATQLTDYFNKIIA